ncbi:MAG: hypothetical protein WBV94_02290, partial [Blastocatellia bacterium]
PFQGNGIELRICQIRIANSAQGKSLTPLKPYYQFFLNSMPLPFQGRNMYAQQPWAMPTAIKSVPFGNYFSSAYLSVIMP